MEIKELKLDDRSGYKLNLLSNLNYYGNLDPNIFGKPVKTIVFSNTYEELKCISYHPENKELRASVFIKNQSGYLGSHCKSGSTEYVRFYIDYNNDNSWEDLGLSSFKIHDIEDHKGLCYGLKLKINPKITNSCAQTPVLPNVRAILSWNIDPPAETPNFTPVWGSVIEARIQIAPKAKFQIDPILKNPISINNTLIPTGLPPLSFSKFNKKIDLASLKKVYKDVDESRLASMALKSTVLNYKDIILSKKLINAAKIDISKKALTILKTPKFNTNYEELKCVSLNRKLNELHADIHIKKASGYSGDLCSQGSNEYVAFYMDFGKGWKFMGTSSVTVYDIKDIPKTGLWYNTYLPIDLTPWQKAYCKEGRAKVKGILSWNTPPTANDPNFVATYGDWEICTVEIKPFSKNIDGIKNQPWIESLGGVDTDIIFPTSGLAEGASGMGNNIQANYSPFDGKIYITGEILNPSTNAKYKVFLKEPGQSPLPLNKNFKVVLTTWDTVNGTRTRSTVAQQPVGGYYNYLPKTTGNLIKRVNDDILAVINPTSYGIHEIYIESETGTKSDAISFFVDKDKPEASIKITSTETILPGGCKSFSGKQPIEGGFSVKNDRHLGAISLKLVPNGQNHVTATLTSSSDAVTVNGISIKFDDQDSNRDYFNGTFSIDATKLKPCGYVIHVIATDRTIVNSSIVGKRAISEHVGFIIK
ncbi:hypothetical protein [Aquimarina agarivorans]|uniref:hypothetical protein n=1 Tax=Aquimarina agarivorans TaxID=980584 RepID=UPI000248EFF8|nr:hypothetical protein [Aquimarina agarivorans]